VFEDFTPGKTIETARRQVTQADIAAFADLSGDHNRLHLDEAYAATTAFGGCIAHGALGIAIATGLVSQMGITAGTLVALAGLEWKFKAPIRPGDTVRIELLVLEQRALERSDRGVVRLAITILNQRDEVVQTGELTELVKTRAG
jgi:acyl dehydratase